MKILYDKNDNGNLRVDFKEPPCVNAEQLETVKQLLRDIKIEYDQKKVEEKERHAADNVKHEDKPWTDDQKLLLFDVYMTDEKIAEKTGHSSYGVLMKRGEVLSDYAVWCEKNKLNETDDKNRKKFLGAD